MCEMRTGELSYAKAMSIINTPQDDFQNALKLTVTLLTLFYTV